MKFIFFFALTISYVMAHFIGATIQFYILGPSEHGRDRILLSVLYFGISIFFVAMLWPE